MTFNCDQKSLDYTPRSERETVDNSKDVKTEK